MRDLFTTIEGRIDAGLVIAGDDEDAAPGTFLGLRVADLDIVRCRLARERSDRWCGCPSHKVRYCKETGRVENRDVPS